MNSGGRTIFYMHFKGGEPFSDGPYVVRAISTYQDVCVCVNVT